jgi:hypothetical protein
LLATAELVGAAGMAALAELPFDCVACRDGR